MSFGENKDQNPPPAKDDTDVRKPYEPNNYGKYGMEPIVHSRRIHSPKTSRDPSPQTTNTGNHSNYGSESKPYDPNLKTHQLNGDRDAFADKLRSKLNTIQSKVPPKTDDSQSRRGHNNMRGLGDNIHSNDKQNKPHSPD